MSSRKSAPSLAEIDAETRAAAATIPDTKIEAISQPPANVPPLPAEKKPRAYTTTVYLENSDLKHSYILVKTGKELTGIYEFDGTTGELVDLSGSVMMRAAGSHILKSQRKLLVKLAEYRLEVAETANRPFHQDSFGALLTAASLTFAQNIPFADAANS